MGVGSSGGKLCISNGGPRQLVAEGEWKKFMKYRSE